MRRRAFRCSLRVAWRSSCAIALLASASAGAEPEAPADPDARQIMAEIVEALRVDAREEVDADFGARTTRP